MYWDIKNELIKQRLQFIYTNLIYRKLLLL